jgi:hypothetical protein
VAPKGIPLIELEKVPDDAKPWLASTRCVQSSDPKFQAIAKEITGEATSVGDLIRRANDRITTILQAQTGHCEELDALEALVHRGSCTSNANLAAAVFRACGVPARVVAGYPLWSGPLQTHYVVELWCPRQGWLPFESTLLKYPWPGSQQIQVSVVQPADEDASAQRPCAAGGVPYLSLTEAPGCEDKVAFMPSLSTEHPGCDHEAVLVRAIPADAGGWPDTLAKARVSWTAWLARAAKGPVPGSEQARRRPLEACEDTRALRAALERLRLRWL